MDKASTLPFLVQETSAYITAFIFHWLMVEMVSGFQVIILSTTSHAVSVQQRAAQAVERTSAGCVKPLTHHSMLLDGHTEDP